MILVYKGKVHRDSESARKHARISHKDMDAVVDELWAGDSKACWRGLRDGASEEVLKQAQSDSLAEAVYILQSEITSRGAEIQYMSSRVQEETTRLETAEFAMTQLRKVGESI